MAQVGLQFRLQPLQFVFNLCIATALRESSRSRLRSIVGFEGRRWSQSFSDVTQTFDFRKQQAFELYLSRIPLGMYPEKGRAFGM